MADNLPLPGWIVYLHLVRRLPRASNQRGAATNFMISTLILVSAKCSIHAYIQSRPLPKNE